MDLIINQAKSIQGSIQVPGDKSISHRALIFGSLCNGQVEITNFLEAADCLSTLKCLQDLGVPIEMQGSDVVVSGVGKYGFTKPSKPLDVGNSGTTLRLLPGILAAQDFETTLIGDESVSKRPMDRITKPLSLMGAEIENTDGHAPLIVRGGKLSAINYQLPVASAQVKSAILLAGLFAAGKMVVSEKYKSRDHTERMLSYLEANLQVEGETYTISPDSELKAKPIMVPADISSAAFFIIAALLLPGSQLELMNIGTNPTRVGLLDVLKSVGAHVTLNNEREVNNEPVADLGILNVKDQMSNVKPLNIEAKDVPGLVDEIPILTVLATQISGTSVISGAQELRVKESDRLAAMTAELRKMGADIEEKPDGLVVNGPSSLKGAKVDSHDDHRIAMSLAVAGLVAEGQTVISGAQSINISFPGFSKLLDKIVDRK